MPGVLNHGGHCCGIRHIYNFGNCDAVGLRSLDQCMSQIPNNRLMEITLTDRTLALWWPSLKKRGFKQVTRFRNSNSGNHVTVLHFVRKPAPLKNPCGEVKEFAPFRDVFGRFASKGKAK